jgi:uncharacterized membrane protein
MHSRFDEKGRSKEGDQQNSGVGFLVLPVLVLIVLVTLAIVQPTASNWISEAMQAEFTGDIETLPVQSPTQIARPAMQIRTVDAH